MEQEDAVEIVTTRDNKSSVILTRSFHVFTISNIDLDIDDSFNLLVKTALNLLCFSLITVVTRVYC